MTSCSETRKSYEENPKTVPYGGAVLSSGAVELLKWLALVAMLVDHVNAVFFARELGTWATITGRLAMPLFAVVLGYNLARPGADLAGCLRRLLGFGLLAFPAYAYLFAMQGGWWPLNILGTFAVGVGVTLLAERRQFLLALVVFTVGGALVEYWWAGVLMVTSSRALALHGWRDGYAPVVSGLALASLCLVNGNAWALLAVPVVLLVAWWGPHCPRAGRFFWWFYPVHLVAIALLSVPMG